MTGKDLKYMINDFRSTLPKVATYCADYNMWNLSRGTKTIPVSLEPAFCNGEYEYVGPLDALTRKAKIGGIPGLYLRHEYIKFAKTYPKNIGYLRERDVEIWFYQSKDDTGYTVRLKPHAF